VLCLTLSKTGTYTGLVTQYRSAVPEFGARWLIGAVALAAAALGTTHAARVAALADQRSMYVSVVDESGAPVPHLGPADFIVREDNVAREILRVGPATEPMQLVLLVDNSVAARDYTVDIRRGLHDFVNAMMGPSDIIGKNRMAITTLADRPTIVTDYTSDVSELNKGVDRIFPQPNSGTLLLQGIIDVCRGFKAHEASRPVIVAITTEGPEFSDRYFDLVLNPLKDSGAAFHALVVGPPSSDTGDAARNRGIVLDQGTRESGGRRENLLSSMSLPGRLTSLAAELTHQYLVTYAHPQSLIPPEHVTVSATRPGLTARGTLARDQGSRP
jgi:hypothetical protein